MTTCCSQVKKEAEMKSTADLLKKALSKEEMPYWTKKLGLARQTLHTAKVRGRLSPAIAGALAEELGEALGPFFVRLV